MEAELLRQLMAAYFHEDFQDVYGGVWETIDAFVADDPAESVLLPDEIAAVLAEFPTEEATAGYVISLGCCYQPQPNDGGYRGWLAEIARRVSSAVGGARPV
ncbi:contact-dependent growth inhibition system immunity protein [Nocardioides ungokensis]|uniref:contact-dependent growth inhibition system immunity protein n=1 Tax=Nocardioides ungokensis TaxID=1643322 RepID=UPI0015DEAC6A|nr:contact-dependent growth inhibition system immunity protein [Nocardioides ungokensis]